MEATEAAEKIREAAEQERAEHEAIERFRVRAAIIIAVLAGLLAIASVGGENAAKEMTNSNIRASDTWAFYQAKNIRQTSNQLAADALESMLLVNGATLSEEARQDIQRKIERYRQTAARYESEPDPNEPDNPLKGEGKRELSAQARYWENKRDHAEAQDRNFDYAQGLFQIAVVLGSVAIVAVSRPILALAVALGGVATLLMLNGFFLWFSLPGGNGLH
ncbi:MAG TPA: DUF4337 domain-containing protein [Chloroflexota bacterium]|jgi:hypothetical protein|nr:DUF4337 domain-containing protein [Chloroflexota bacterium]